VGGQLLLANATLSTDYPETERSLISTGGEAGYALPFFGATVVPSLRPGLALVSRSGDVSGDYASPYLGFGFAYLFPLGTTVFLGYDIEYRYHWHESPNESHHEPSSLNGLLVLGLHLGAAKRDGGEHPTSHSAR